MGRVILPFPWTVSQPGSPALFVTSARIVDKVDQDGISTWGFDGLRRVDSDLALARVLRSLRSSHLSDVRVASICRRRTLARKA
jgi:hypothetical protein